MTRVEELTFRLVDQGLSQEEQAELDCLLADGDAQRERHVALLELEAALRGDGTPPSVHDATLTAIREGQSDDLERSVMRTLGELPEPQWLRQSSGGENARSHRRLLAVAMVLATFAAAGICVAVLWQTDTDASPVIVHKLGPLETHRGDTAGSADVGTILHPGTRLSVPEDDGFAVLKYPDGTRLELFGPTQLMLGRTESGGKLVRLVDGGLRADVRPQPADRPMMLMTPQGSVRVLGTRFRVFGGEERTRIEMEDGKVRFTRREDGRSVDVSRGSYVVVDGSGETPGELTPRPMPPVLTAPLWSGSKLGEIVAYSASGERLASCDRRGRLRLLAADDGAVLRELFKESNGSKESGKSQRQEFRLHELRFTGQDRWLVGLTNRGDARFWNLVNDEVTVEPISPKDTGVKAIGDGGRWLARTPVLPNSPLLRIYAVHTDGPRLEPIVTVEGRTELTAAAVSSSGALAAAGARAGFVHLFDLPGGAERWQVRLAQRPVMALAFSPDDCYLAAFNFQAGIRLLSTETGEMLQHWLPEGPTVYDLAFSADGSVLAAALADGTVRLWSVSDGQPLLIIETGQRRLRSLAFSPDGTRLATAGRDVALWKLP